MEKIVNTDIMPDPPLVAPKPRKSRAGNGVTVANLEMTADEIESKRHKEAEKQRPKRKYTRKAKETVEALMADAAKLLAASPSGSNAPSPVLKAPIVAAHKPDVSLPFATATPPTITAAPLPPPAAKPIGPLIVTTSFNPAPYKPPALASTPPSFMPAVGNGGAGHHIGKSSLGVASSTAIPPNKLSSSTFNAIANANKQVYDSLEAVEKQRQQQMLRVLLWTFAGGAVAGVALWFWGSKFVSAVSDGVANTPASVAQSQGKVAAKVAAKAAKRAVQFVA